MTVSEMIKLKHEYGDEMRVTRAIHLHDEDEWNKYCISYRDVVVGSELVSVDFVKKNIARHFAR